MPALGLVRARSVHLRAEVADPRGAAELCGAADNARVRSFRGGLNAHNKKGTFSCMRIFTFYSIVTRIEYMNLQFFSGS
jgi:hypothetical protein